MSIRAPSRPDGEMLEATLEALIFASDEPVSPQEIAEAFGAMDLTEIESALERLARCYERRGSGVRLEKVAGGYRFYSRAEVGRWVRQFFRERNRTRLSAAALETLAIVAYRQPVTAPEIQAIRGRDPSAALRTLVEKRLVRILGKKKVVGSPLLYGTSKQFLIHFGLDRLGDLPSIEEFDELLGGLEVERLAAAGERRSEQDDVDAPDPAGANPA